MVPSTALLLAACGGGAGGSADPGPEPSPPPGLTDAEIVAIFEARTDSLRRRYTVADIRFVTGMIGHHAQALVMADLVPPRRADPSLDVLAGRIINAQQDEIALMGRWLRDRGQEVPPTMPRSVDAWAGVSHSMHMQGMLTNDQLRELESARGVAFDRLFLTYMIQHHEGAVAMVHELFATDGAAQDQAVFKLASDIQVDQITEVERMRLMLEEMAPGARPDGGPASQAGGL